MTHIFVRKIVGDTHNFAGRSWWYDFSELPKRFDEEKVAKHAQTLLQHFAQVTGNWTSDLNSEWTVRVFFAAKMVFSASIMAQSLRFAESKNLRAVISYLQYYTVLHSLRAIALTNPHIEWNSGEILKMTHQKAINVAFDILARFNQNLSQDLKREVLHLKAFRELISYRAPSSGDQFPKPTFDILEFARLCLEVSQLQSELLEASIDKNVTASFELDPALMSCVSEVEIDGIYFHDNEDWYRIGYLARKHPRPTNVLHIMSEGHVEDFFGSWCEENPTDSSFDPDEDWRVLFDVP